MSPIGPDKSTRSSNTSAGWPAPTPATRKCWIRSPAGRSARAAS